MPRADELADELSWVLSEIDQIVSVLRTGHDDVVGVEPGSTDVAAAVQAAIHSVHSRSTVNVTVQIVRTFDAAMPPSAVRSVLQNLLSNAGRHARGRI